MPRKLAAHDVQKCCACHCTVVVYTSYMRINASDFKARCLNLLDLVARSGEELVVLKRGRPVARVVPAENERPWLALRDSGKLVGDPFEPVVETTDIEALSS